MAPPTRKFNPGFLTDDELVASYCVRTTEFEMLGEILRECTGHSNPHQLVIGPRGSGKTSLLLRVAAEARRDTALSARYFPVTFAEESYEVGTAGEFWLECLTNLATQAPCGEDAPDLERSVEELRTIRDDQTLSDRCLGALLDFADRERKRLLLLVENLSMLFGDMADPDAGWRMRKVLQTEPRIIMFASATSRFDEIDNPDRALYDLFRVRSLHPLDTKQCAVLWETVSGRPPDSAAVRSLEILTGGSPRLISIVASFGAGLSFRDLMAHLLDLIDDHTEYFKGHLESLPPQERRVYLALAALWKPATTREIADQARLDTSTCSAQLARLDDRGVVRVAGGSARRKQYYLTERLYNIYYLLRRQRGPDRFVYGLIQFMEACYSPPELKDIGAQMARDAAGLTAEMRTLHRIVLKELMESPSLAAYRDELLEMLPAGFVAVTGRGSTRSEVAQTTAEMPVEIDRAEPSQGGTGESAARELFQDALSVQNGAADTVAAYEEVIRRFGESEIPAELGWVAKAFVNKGAALVALNRPQDALEACDEVIRRFGESDNPTIRESVASALLNRAQPLDSLNRLHDVLQTCDEVVRRFGKSDMPALLESVATALVNKGIGLDALNRPQDALESYNEVLRRFGESEVPAVLEKVAKALVKKGAALGMLNQPQAALVSYDEVIRRFGESDSAELLESVANALVNRGATLGTLSRPRDVLEACDEVVRRFGESETPAFLQSVANALMNKGAALGMLNRPRDSLDTCDEVVRRFGQSDSPELMEPVARALVNKGGALGALNRWQEALEACDEVVRRFGQSDSPGLLEPVATALANKGAALRALKRPQEALEACDEVVHRFGNSDSAGLLRSVATALMNSGDALSGLNRPQDALESYDEVLRRLGESDIPAILERVAQALAEKVATLHVLNRPQEALVTCDEVVQRFGESAIPAIQEWVAKALLNRGSAHAALNRPQGELDSCDEVIRRFGERETPALLESVATALANKGVALAALNRPQEALEAFDEVVRRFGESDAPALLRSVATALVNRAGALCALNRHQDALEACDEMVQRFGENENPAVLERVATTLTNKGHVLGALSRRQDALDAYDEVVRRFGDSEIAALRMSVGVALLGRADIEIENRQYERAAKTATRLIARPAGATEQRFLGHVIRAEAILASGGDRSASEQDIRAVLALIPELRPMPREAIMALLEFSVALGPQRMIELIQVSPSPHLLLPLKTALERELGLEPRVAREVDEVAQDVQKQLAALRESRRVESSA